MSDAIAASTIVQLAFEALALSPPSSFGDDSDQVQAAALHFDTAKAMCLEAVDWSFASVIATLSPALDPGPADPRLPHTFKLPADCVMLREVLDCGGAFRADRMFLRSDAAAPVTIRYTATISDESKLPAWFRTAVALQLAAIMAPRFVEVQGKVASIEDRLMQALTRAARSDARTASSLPWRDGADGDWIEEARW